MTPDQERMLIETSETVKRIETGMLGNEYVKGAIPRLNALEARFNKHENESNAKKNQNIGIKLTLGVLWSAFVLLIGEALRYFQNK